MEEKLPTKVKAIIGLLILTAVGSGYFYLNFVRLYGGFDSSITGMLLGIGSPLLAVSSLIAAYGLYRQAKWGWKLSLNIFGLSLGADLILLLISQEASSPVRAVLSAVLIYYILHRREMFIEE